MSARLSARIPQSLKAQLETKAAEEGKNISDYVRDHLPELVKEQGIEVTIEGATGRQSAPLSITAAKEVDPLDDYIITMKKMAVAKMFQQLAMSPTGAMPFTPEQSLAYAQHIKESPSLTSASKKDEISMEDIMKYNTIMTQMLTQAELARRAGRPEESGKFMEQYMTMGQQQQNMMNQFMQQQTSLFQTALSIRKEGEDASKQATNSLRQEMRDMSQKMTDTQLHSQQQISALQMQHLQQQIEDIRNAPTEMDKMRELAELAKEDPAIDAYMKKRLGIKETGKGLTFDDVTKGLKGLNVNLGDLVDGVTGFLKSKAQTPLQSSPQPTVPQPAPLTPEQQAELSGLTLEQPPPIELPPEKPPTYEISYEELSSMKPMALPKKKPEPKTSKTPKTKAKGK